MIKFVSNISVSKGTIGSEKCAQTFFCTSFSNTAKGPGHPGKIPGTSQMMIPLFEKPKEDKLSREGTNFSATTPSRGRPPPHRAVSGPKKLIFVLFFLALILDQEPFKPRVRTKGAMRQPAS